MKTEHIEVIAVVVVMLFMFFSGFWIGENSENKRVCSAWYENLNLTTSTYQGLVFDNGTIVNFTINATR